MPTRRLGVTLVGESIAQPRLVGGDLDGGLIARVCVGFVLWAVFVAAPWAKLVPFRKYQGDLSTTDGIDYEAVGSQKGYRLDRYWCPALPIKATASQLEAACRRITPHLAAHAWLKVPTGAPLPGSPTELPIDEVMAKAVAVTTSYTGTAVRVETV